MAEVEALLRQAEAERDAVRGAMKVVKGENGRLRELSAGAAKKAEEKATEEGTKAEDVDQTPLKGDGETEVSAKGTKWEVVEPEAQPKPNPNPNLKMPSSTRITPTPHLRVLEQIQQPKSPLPSFHRPRATTN